jgi:phage terminase large subunit-like protein
MEPPEDVYTEGLTRTNATAGIVWPTSRLRLVVVFIVVAA